VGLTYLNVSRAFLACIILAVSLFTSAPAQARDFQSWLEDLRREAIQCGISDALVADALPDTLEPNATIIRLDHKQPEGGISFQRYKNNVVTASRIRAGRERMLQYRSLLRSVSHAYGVQPQYIVTLWGMETSYGSNTGGFETIPALVTLAYDARRGPFFREELLKALRIVDKGDVSLHDMVGSWAGAMGQCQFMPTSYEKYAQDFDGDGKADIWHSKADVFASTANYLSKNGWKKTEPWGVRIMLPKGFDNGLIGVNTKKSLEEWRRAGVHLKTNVFSQDELLSIVQSGGEGYKMYLVGDNYRILLQWNTSTYFATAAGLLADELKGG
jgi:membrane-bound lytic murein transglycosylase B